MAISFTLTNSSKTLKTANKYVPENIQLNVQSADDYTLYVPDSPSNSFNVEPMTSDNRYPISTNIRGTLTAETPGWFTSGTATSALAVVGSLPKASIIKDSSGVANPTAEASISNASGDLINLGTNGTGISISAPSGTMGTDYWKISPSLKTTAAYTSDVDINCTTAGYMPEGFIDSVDPNTLPVTETIGDSYYISKATVSGSNITPTFSVSGNTSSITGATNINSFASVSLTAPTSGFFYPINIGATGSTTLTNSAGYMPASSQLKTVSANGSDIAYVTVSKATTNTSVSGNKIITTISPGFIGENTTIENTIQDGSISAAGLTMDTTLNDSTNSGITITKSAGYIDAGTLYVSAVSVASGKTLSSLTNNGIISSYFGNGEIASIGAPSKLSTLSITDNTYGTIKIWGASGSRTAQVSGHTVTVDGTTVTNSSGDLTKGTYTAKAAGSVLTSPDVSVTATATGFTASGSSTPYYIELGNSSTPGKVRSTSTAEIGTAGWVTANSSQTATAETSVSATVSGASGKIYIPAMSLSGKTDSIDSSAYTEYDHNGSATGTGDFGINDGYLYLTAGYTPNIKINLGTIIPDDVTFPTAGYILTGYSIYNGAGQKVVGTMADNKAYSSSITSQGGSVTIPAGYHNGSGKITANINNGAISATPAVTQKTYDGTNSTALSTDILLSSAPSGGYYKIEMDPSVSISVGTAGYISSTAGTKTANSGTTINKYLAKGALTAGSGSSSIETVETSPTGSGGKAKVTNSTSTTPYVTVSATGSGSVSVGTTGYLTSGTSQTSSTATSTARIAAAVNPSVTAGTPTASAISFTSASTFNETSGDVTKSTKTGSSQIGAVTVLNASTDYKDKYIVGTFTAKTNSGTANATVGNDFTGSTVDDYVEALYKRILGMSYTAVTAD